MKPRSPRLLRVLCARRAGGSSCRIASVSLSSRRTQARQQTEDPLDEDHHHHHRRRTLTSTGTRHKDAIASRKKRALAPWLAQGWARLFILETSSGLTDACTACGSSAIYLLYHALSTLPIVPAGCCMPDGLLPPPPHIYHTLPLLYKVCTTCPYPPSCLRLSPSLSSLTNLCAPTATRLSYLKCVACQRLCFIASRPSSTPPPI